ncbi:hypothetical protein CSB09_04365 [Candidatus Gracilibacteria bacterium]|nr:MAG: hypothetical protein CSB09_04365 [Candidatus Gracilibacteria bacterium]
MKHTLISICILSCSLLLVSCGNTQTTDTSPEKEQEKIPFEIQIKKIADINNDITQEKIGIVKASSSLVLNSNIAGDVIVLGAKEGDTIGKGAVIAKISDNIYGYGLAVKSAQANLRAQKLQKNASQYNLDQTIITAKSAYQQAREAATTVRGNTNIQYDSLVQKNKDTLASYNESYQTYLKGIEQQMTQYLHEGDKILGITENYERKNDSWEDYLGIHSGDGRKVAIDEWNALYKERGVIRKIISEGKSLETGDIDKKILDLEKGYKALRTYTQSMITMIQNNLVGYGITIQQQQMWVSQWNGIQNGIQQSEAGFKAWKAQILPFLTNYEKTEEATRLATARLTRALTAKEFDKLENDSALKLRYKEILLSLQNKDAQAKIGLEQAQQSYENTKKIKQATLSQLQANIERAQIALQQAQYNASKLTIRAPMKGMITKILVEKGQSVGAGTPIAEFASDAPEIRIDISPSLARMIQVGDALDIIIEDEKYTGTVTARSLVAGKNLLSSLRIALPKNTNLIGKTAKVVFSENLLSQSKKSFLLPLTAVKIISEDEGEITLLSAQNTLKTEHVALGRIFGKNVEVITDLEENSILVLSDTNNFDEKKFKLVPKQDK